MKYRQARIRADILKSMAHPVRVLIIDALSKGDRCVGDLHKLVRIHQSNVSRHLACLKKAGIVSDRRDGMHVFYRLETPCILPALECTVDVAKSDHARRAERIKVIT